MEKKTNIWSLNFAFLLSIFLHIYVIFFLTGFNLDFFDKKKRVTITLSAIGIMEESPKESIKKKKIKKKIAEIKKIKKKSKEKIKKKIDIKKTLPQEKSLEQKKTKESDNLGTLKGIKGGVSKEIINQYVTQVYKLIDAKKKYPRQSLIRREEGTVLLEIIIHNNGQLKSVKSIKAKFQRLVDSSFDAVESAAPFPAFPKEITNKKMIIQVPVIYTIR
jgi:TonB family protein